MEFSIPFVDDHHNSCPLPAAGRLTGGPIATKVGGGIILLIILTLMPALLPAQNSSTTNKYSIALSIAVGHSFPDFNRPQDRWQASFYPAGGISLSFETRLNQDWTLDLGIGLTGYALTNRGPVDRYVLDFASPTLSSGLSYHFQNKKRQDNFIRISGGVQLAYQGEILDEFETYSIHIASEDRLYPFIQPEIGIRRFSRKRMKGSRYKMACDLGVFFRFKSEHPGNGHNKGGRF